LKKGFFLLPGLILLVALALMPATSFAAPATSTGKAHSAHIFHSRNSSKPHVKLVRAANATSTSNPYSSYNLTYQGGPVMAGTANVYAIFWEPTSNVSANYNSLIQRYFNDVGSSLLYQIASQYTQTGGTFPSNAVLAGTWVDTQAYPETPLLDSDIQNEVTRAQSAKSWTSSIDNIFFVFTEKDEGLCYDSAHTQCTPNISVPSGGVQFCAYHSYFGASNDTIYAAMPYAASPTFNSGCDTGTHPNGDDADATINVTSHEQMEAATDPELNAWYNNDSSSQVYQEEIGDLCAWTFGPDNSQGGDVTWNSHNYLVQQEWNNSVTGCTLVKTVPTQFFEFVNRNSGLVADVTGASTSPGTQVIQYLNRINTDQQWQLVPDGPFYQFQNRNSGLVLDISGGSASAGANVIQNTNSNSPSQQWYFWPDGAFNALVNANSGLVLDVKGASTATAAPLIQYTFKNSTNQQWTVSLVTPVTYYEFKNVNSGLVMDLAGGSLSAGAKVIQYTNHNGVNQNWYIVPDGSTYEIVNRNSGMVLDVAGASTSAGAQIIQYANRHNANQEWRILPSLSACQSGSPCQFQNVNSGMVVDVSGGSLSAGANVVQEPNTNATSQQWTLVKVS
jgi:hypothetical protein